MDRLPESLKSLGAYKQFILWTIIDGRKLPLNPRTLQAASVSDPSTWTDATTTFQCAAAYGPQYRVGFVFTDKDPFFFIDIDNCFQNGKWSPITHEMLSRLPGAAVETSQSGIGLHIIGTGESTSPHKCENSLVHLELYTESRFIALTGLNMSGSAGIDLTEPLRAIIDEYFPVKSTSNGTPVAVWTDRPVPKWNGHTDDTELIRCAIASKSTGGIFGGRASFNDLWTANETVLNRTYPDDHRDDTWEYNISSADAALAQHLAFWTGNNHTRIYNLMWQSALVREKWYRTDYLPRTIRKAVSLQTTVYTAGKPPTTDHHGPKLRASSDKQRAYADNIRNQIITTCDKIAAKQLLVTSGPVTTAKFWIDNQDKTPVELCAMTTKIIETVNPLDTDNMPIRAHGYQYLSANLQIDFFRGCVYIQNIHRVFTPTGSLLKPEQFNATYGGYTFQLDDTGDKITRKAWEAFTESQVIRFPKTESTCFRPQLTSGIIIAEEGQKLVNIYVPIETLRISGDITPFTDLMARVLPNEHDRAILLAYMAACIQYKGVKFQWAPLLQGVDGNGKTLFTRCVSFAVGKRYTFYPKASEIDNKFNAWLANKIFIGVEDIYVSDNRQEIMETLKPMITSGDGIEIQMKGVDQITTDICANFIFNSNHKNAIKKTDADRRFAIFFTAQQEKKDLKRDGMSGDYFPNLYDWFREGGGYAMVSEYLHTYQIPDELNPATKCHRAPETSSTVEAIETSIGSIEQEIIEAIHEGRPGFANGWVSSMALERLLKDLRATRKIPLNRRRDLLRSLGYDWHPALNNGRVNNHILMDGGKPRLFVKNGHLSLNLDKPTDIAEMYEKAQHTPAIETNVSAKVG